LPSGGDFTSATQFVANRAANAKSENPLDIPQLFAIPAFDIDKYPSVIEANYYNHQRERIARLSRFLLWPVKVTAVGCLVPRRRQRRLSQSI
jgi:hypothetical protein